jgi:phenylalanyl-tRNA synthetase alpha chain
MDADSNSGAWKDSSFKQYNFAAAGQPPEGGALHPLLKMREEMRQIFFDMGSVPNPLRTFRRQTGKRDEMLKLA